MICKTFLRGPSVFFCMPNILRCYNMFYKKGGGVVMICSNLIT